MIVISMYTAQWEHRAATRDQRQAETEYAQLARVFCSASGTKRGKQESSTRKSVRTKLLTSLGQAGA